MADEIKCEVELDFKTDVENGLESLVNATEGWYTSARIAANMNSNAKTEKMKQDMFLLFSQAKALHHFFHTGLFDINGDGNGAELNKDNIEEFNNCAVAVTSMFDEKYVGIHENAQAVLAWARSFTC